MTATGISIFTVAAVIAGTASLAQAQTFNVAHGYPPTHPVVAQGLEPWMACVTERTAGEVTFIHFPSGQISSHDNAIDSLNSGVADISAIIIGYVSAQMPLNGISLLPGLGTEAVEMVTAYRAAADASGEIAEEFIDNGLHPVLFNLLPAYQLISTGEPVDTLAKFTSLKTRTSGGSPSLMASALGAIPVEMPTNDMYIAMQRRTVDASFLSLASAKTYAVTELSRSASTNGPFGSGAAVISVNLAKYDALDETAKAAFDDCGREGEMNLARFLDEENLALQDEFTAMGMTLYEYAPAEIEAISEKLAGVADDYVARLEARGLPARTVYDAYVQGLPQ